MMNTKSGEIRNQLLTLLSKKFDIHVDLIEGHCAEPLADELTGFDAIDMVYFVLEIEKEFCIPLNASMLEKCMYWSIEQYIEFIENTDNTLSQKTVLSTDI